MKRLGDFRYMANCAKELERTRHRALGTQDAPNIQLESSNDLTWLSKQSNQPIKQGEGKQGEHILYVKFEGCAFWKEVTSWEHAS